MALEFKNDIEPTKGDEGVKCPLVDYSIASHHCIENAMIISGFMDENKMLEGFKAKENWREICQNCPNFIM